MNWDVIRVATLDNTTLEIRFADGLEGRVRFAPDFFTGVFEPMRDPRVFHRVFIDHGVVTWPGEVDLAPDAMYDAIKRHGEWILTGAKLDVQV